MKRFHKVTAITLAGIGALAIAASPGFASGGSEGAREVAPWHPVQGMMTPAFRGPAMMNFGMMGPAMMGYVMLPAPGADLNLSIDDVRGQLDQSLTWHGNKRIKVGEVKEVGENTIVADIVTQDGSLVQRFEVNRHTGQMLQAE